MKDQFSRFHTLSVAAVAALILALVFPVVIAEAQLGTANSCQDPDYINRFSPMYRQWNSGLVDHFYTNSPTETGSGYVAEQPTGNLISTQATGTSTGTVPLYRYYSASLSDHFYSSSSTAPAGYVSEGVIGYMFPASVPGSTPLYRLYRHINSDPANGDHMYTISATERDAATAHGYRYESIEGYVCTAS